MIREIMRDEAFLAQKAEPAASEDLPVAQDLLDTLEANREHCVGMAANMIGVNKRIIVFDNEGTYMVMFNPEIINPPSSLLHLSYKKRRRAFQNDRISFYS